MQQLGTNVFVETGYDWANVAAVVTKSGAVLIDCPVRPSDSAHWQQVVKGLHPKGGRYLITTDYHGDHVAGSSFIEGIGDTVNFLAPQVAFDEIQKSDNAFSKEIFVETLRDQGHTEEADKIQNAPIPSPTFCWEETMLLHLEPYTFNIRRLAGHSPATSSVYLPEEGILFSSDIVSHHGGGMRDAHIGDWIRALDWIEALPIETIVPGHGDICGKDVVRKQRQRMVDILGAVGDLVNKGLSKDEVIVDEALTKRFFRVDTSRGEYWLNQRRETFREGISRVYDEIKGVA
ncbi:MBL fold metallo-hydrolase [Mesorhizobium sp. YR577]|jgi:cyclase|uniref:MBL fold metallo-hydrolase n=1 Tax=Mesorhizobium sp. YR577 TaxID=1884373 RepID=UPI0008F0029F|nr:MBL fold metallo-hydrolase [Mesorhizobium sp. YR577]SFT47682.1 Glyoxylase, beta-lactamase superfamily II [Mesorhizobium sp. YR577]